MPEPPSPPAEAWAAWFSRHGPVVPFERFMAAALHDPRLGYYRRHVEAVGLHGDFATSATLSPRLGQAVARWALANRRAGGLRGPWHLTLLGPGDGSLARSLLASFPFLARRRLVLHLVETSARLRDRQREALPARGLGGLLWHEDATEAIEEAGGRTLLFGNEFADAFPCVRLLWQAGRWREIGVRLDGRRLTEVLLDVGPPRARELAACGIFAWRPPRDGWRVECHPALKRWMAGLAPAWTTGRMLLVDYGGEAIETHAARPRGTLRAFWHHERLEGAAVYARPGRQDLTADVAFDDLARWAHGLGWEAAPRMSQRSFLGRWAPGGRRRAPTLPRDEAEAAAAFVARPGGAGDAFQVLEVRADPRP